MKIRFIAINKMQIKKNLKFLIIESPSKKCLNNG